MGFLHTDVPELRDYDTGLVLSNLARLAGRQLRVSESVLSQLWELAEAVRRDAGGDPDVEGSILLSLQDAADAESGPSGDSDKDPDGNDDMPPDTAGINRELLTRLTRAAGVPYRLVLYRFLCEQAGGLSDGTDGAAPRAAEPGPSDRGVTPSAKGRIAYMKGAFADKAYLRFSEVIPGCRAAGFHGFVDACEEVYNGLCEFCILPLESTAEGRLTAFSRLIIKYELMVVAVCDVENGAVSGHPVTRFGLLSRRRADPLSRADAAGGCLELLHTTAASPSLSELLTAADFCRLRLLRADTLPAAGSDDTRPASDDAAPPTDDPMICVVLDTADASPLDLGTFRLFLELEAPDDTVMGVYRTV